MRRVGTIPAIRAVAINLTFEKPTGYQWSILEGERRGSQVVRQRSAKPLFGGSIPPRASNDLVYFSCIYASRGIPLIPSF